MVKPTLRRVLGMGTLLLIALATVWALRPAPLAVETTLATRGDLTATVVAEGRVRVKDVYVVAAPVDGDLERIAVEPGDTVRPGAPVARIWPIAPRPLDARSRAEAEASVVSARATVARAEATQKEAAGALATRRASSRRLASSCAGARPHATIWNMPSTKSKSAVTPSRPPARRPTPPVLIFGAPRPWSRPESPGLDGRPRSCPRPYPAVCFACCARAQDLWHRERHWPRSGTRPTSR